MNLRFIDLFCGIGGFHRAIKLASKDICNTECVFSSDTFVQMLISAKIMFRENGHLQSYQSNIDAGYFTVKISKDINGKARSSTMFTAKGIRWVAKKLELDKLFLD